MVEARLVRYTHTLFKWDFRKCVDFLGTLMDIQEASYAMASAVSVVKSSFPEVLSS